jgi:SAM-dependent methyltransferase
MTSHESDSIFRARLAQPDVERLAAIRAERWTGHNIPLTEDESTIPGVILIGNDERTIAIKSTVRRFLGTRDTLRVLDLGSLEGGLSLEMAREGWNVLGVEGRESNYRKAELIRDYFGLPNLTFAWRDVKSLDRAQDGTFDVILCCGLLYHIDNPFALLERLRTLLADDGVLFLDTHVAPDEASLRYGTHAAHLSEPATFEHGGRTYDGRWFHEPQATVLDQQWSAVSNERSFWPERRALIRGLYHSGFQAIHELFGVFEIDRELGLRDQFSRHYFACQPRW